MESIGDFNAPKVALGKKYVKKKNAAGGNKIDNSYGTKSKLKMAPSIESAYIEAVYGEELSRKNVNSFVSLLEFLCLKMTQL